MAAYEDGYMAGPIQLKDDAVVFFKNLVAAVQDQVKNINIPFGDAVLQEFCAALFKVFEISQGIVSDYGHTMGWIDYLALVVNLLLVAALTWLALRLLGVVKRRLLRIFF